MDHINKKMPHKKSSLSQVFLRDEEPCYKMIDALKSSGVSDVCEIGPGGGILTKLLLDAGMKVTAIDKDQRFCDFLTEKLCAKHSNGKNLTLINKDFLDFSLQEWIEENKGKKLAICGNIPYSISSAIITKTVSLVSKVEGVWLLVQHDFAKRLVASPCTKAYGSLSVYLQLRAKVKLEFFVDKICFTPVPKVDSAVISIKNRDHHFSSQQLAKTEKLTKYLFSKRRKKLKTSLKAIIDLKTIPNFPFDLDKRCEVFTPEELLQMAELLK